MAAFGRVHPDCSPVPSGWTVYRNCSPVSSGEWVDGIQAMFHEGMMTACHVLGPVLRMIIFAEENTVQHVRRWDKQNGGRRSKKGISKF